MFSLRPYLRSLAIGRVLHASSRNCLTYNRGGGTYEGDGKTSVTLLNRDVDDLLLIDSYSTHGFRINNGLFVCGPAAFFPRTILSWDVEGPWDVTIGSLSLFWLLEPKPDVLVIGVGDKGNTIDEEVRIFMHKKKISLEILDSGAACHVFNYMNADNRNVAAALIPMQTMALREDTEFWDNALIKGKLFHSDGSSITDVADERERRETKINLEVVDLLEKNQYEPVNKIIMTDLKEMMERGMITPQYVQQKYPQYSLEAIQRGDFEEAAAKALPLQKDKKLLRDADKDKDKDKDVDNEPKK